MRLLLLKIILIFLCNSGVQSNPFAPIPGDPKAIEYEEFKVLFDENQAKGLFSKYEETGQKQVFLNHFLRLSAQLNQSITTESRSKDLLHVLRVINAFHDESHELRFAILENLNATHLYDLIWIWQSALYTSSFNGALDRLMVRVMKNPIDFVTHLQEDSYQGFISIVQTASSFNRLEDFLSLFEIHHKLEFYDVLVQNLMDSSRMDYLITLGEWLLLEHEVGNQKSYLRILVRDLIDWQNSHEAVNLKYQKPPDWTLSNSIVLSKEELFPSLIQILTRYQALNPNHVALLDTPLSKFLSAYSHLLPGFENLQKFKENYLVSKAPLRSPEEDPIQLRHLYYSDSDGWATYLNFVRLYQRDENWSYVDSGDIVEFYREMYNGQKLRLKLNKPSSWSKVFKQKSEPIFAFIHRGHSYHLHRGYDQLFEETKLAILGSCGGFDSMFKILSRSPEAKIILSKGKGTVWINESILFAIHEQLASQGKIEWAKIREQSWAKLDSLISERFLKRFATKEIFEKYYILPQENLGAICYQTHLEREEYKGKLAWMNSNSESPFE